MVLVIWVPVFLVAKTLNDIVMVTVLGLGRAMVLFNRYEIRFFFSPICRRYITVLVEHLGDIIKRILDVENWGSGSSRPELVTESVLEVVFIECTAFFKFYE